MFNLRKVPGWGDRGRSNASGDFQTHFFPSVLARPACSELKHITSGYSWDMGQVLITAKEVAYLNLIFPGPWLSEIRRAPSSIWVRERNTLPMFVELVMSRWATQLPHPLPSPELLLIAPSSIFQWWKLQVAVYKKATSLLSHCKLLFLNM